MTSNKAVCLLYQMYLPNFDDEEKEALTMAINAIQKQMPTKPIGKHTNYKCPICNRRVRSGKGSSSFGVDHFCQRCGQALDWNESQ